MIKILFVCTGNICRSPTAEGVFRHLVREAGLSDRIETDSAGTHDYHLGEPPDRRSIACAYRRGVDISDLRARQVREQDFSAFDLILAMDRGHLAALKRIAPPGAEDKVRLFLDYAPASRQREVPDPYYGDHDHFEEAFALCEAAARGLLETLRREMLALP